MVTSRARREEQAVSESEKFSAYEASSTRSGRAFRAADTIIVEKTSTSLKTSKKGKSSAFSKLSRLVDEFLLPLCSLIGIPALAVLLAVLSSGMEDCKECSNLFALKELNVWRVWGFLKANLDPWIFLVLVSWHLFAAALYYLLPGPVVAGLPIRQLGEKRLRYRLNGHLQFWVTLLVSFFGYPSYKGGEISFGAFPLHLLVEDHYVPLVLASVVLSFIYSSFFFLWSLRKNAILTEETAGKKLINPGGFWLGRELNPRAFNWIDWKVYMDLKVSIIGWTLMNIGYLMAEKEKKGYYSSSLLLITIFQGIYSWDSLFFESAILSTLDIIKEGLGFMLVFGGITWIPFMYSLQGHCVLYYEPDLSPLALVLITGLFIFGYWIFRASNSEKDAFRRGPYDARFDGKSFLITASGRLLLTSGWWGAARKINYTGDLLMSLSWCLLSGTGNPIAYFYSVFLLILLTHRAYRDHKKCSEMYGDTWKEYCKKTPYVFIPYII